MNKLSIIIPVFNEEKTIEELLKKVLAVHLPIRVNKEIIIINDGSTDKTREVLSKFKMNNLQFKILEHKKNRGKGAAVRTGIRQATGDLMLVQDADLEYDPKYYAKLIEPILKGKALAVYGSRLLDYPLKLWGKDKTVMPFHLMANKMLTLLTNLLFGSKLTDMETCYKVFKKEVIEKISLSSNGFDFEPEITAKILKLKIPIEEVSIKVKPRTYTEGKKIGVKDGVLAIWTLLKFKVVN